MAFWSRVRSIAGNLDIVANPNGPDDYNPGDPDGIVFTEGDPVESRSMALPVPSPWDGWATGWNSPDWQQTNGDLNKLVDIAWACLDLNSNIVSSMPVYQLKNGQIMDPEAWMSNPDPDIYGCWQEFAKQLFWDYQMGEAFVLPFATDFNNKPVRFRVIPPFLINVEMKGGVRSYKLGAKNVTDEILHIRYHSSTISPRGVGPLEIAGARITTIRLLQRYTNTLAENGGVPLYWMEVARRLQESEGRDILDRWIESRAKYAGQPALVGSGAKLNQAKSMSAKDMALMELSQFSESRIAILLGVPPFLVGLAGATGSLTYSNISDLFDFHDRSSLRPKTRMVMECLSQWALPRGRSIESNRDDYTRLPLDKRAAIYQTLGPVASGGIGVLTIQDIQNMERFHGETAAQALTGSAD